MASLITYEAIATAAEALAVEGKRPSVRNVRAHLGGGSPNDITLFLQQWKAGRPVVRADDVAIDPRINQIVAEQISRAVAEARAEIQAQLSDAEQDNEVISAAGREAEAQATKLAADLEASKSQIQTQAGQIDQLKADAERVKADAAAQVRQAEERAAGEAAAREAAQVLLAKAELRLEALPRLERETERLQAALDVERTARTDAERTAAGLHATATGQSARVIEQTEQIHKIEAQLEALRTKAEKQLADSVEKERTLSKALENERVAVQAGQARLESAGRELAEARATAKIKAIK